MPNFDRRVVGASNADSQLEFIAALREIRMKNSIPVVDVAAEMGVDPAMIYRFEKGGTNYTATTLRKYAKAVGAYLLQSAHDARDVPLRHGQSQPAPWTPVANMRSFEATAPRLRRSKHPDSPSVFPAEGTPLVSGGFSL